MQNNEPLLGYDFFSSENGYIFETNLGVEYEVKFKSTPYLFSSKSLYADNIFELIITVLKTNLGRPPFDRRTSKTISDIFEDFYQKFSETVTIYICDSSDGRQMARSRKFHIWFEEFQHENYLKIDVILIDSEKKRFPTSLILRRNNPYLLQIFEEFESITSGYSAEK